MRRLTHKEAMEIRRLVNKQKSLGRKQRERWRLRKYLMSLNTPRMKVYTPRENSNSKNIWLD